MLQLLSLTIANLLLAQEPTVEPWRGWPTDPVSISLRSTARGQGLLGCGFELVERGFPAVAADGSAVAWIRHDTVTLSLDFEHELRIGTPGSQPVTFPLHTRATFNQSGAVDSPSAADCRRARKQIEAAVELANAELQRNDWRSLQPLALALVGPDGPVPENRERPADQRPVELSLMHDTLIAKIPKVEVLHREPGFPVPASRTILREAWGDPYSGTALVVYTWLEDCAGDDTCRCNEWTDGFVTRFATKLYDALARTPCPADERERCTTWDQLFY